MDYRVNWSPEAFEDINAIAEYIGRDSEFYARAVISKILSIAKSLKKFPEMGRIVPEIGKENIRERFVYSYRVIYQIKENSILVLAVAHGKRLLESIDERI